jgi:Mrp family chromosome partitioning ATPase
MSAAEPDAGAEVSRPPGADGRKAPVDGAKPGTPPGAGARPESTLAPRDPRSYGLLAVAEDGSRLLATPKPDPRTADGYLRLTAHVLLESKKLGFRTVGVFSAMDGEGRSAAAVNLAVCLGRARGREGRVLLVDADTRQRTLSKLFFGSSRGEGPAGAVRHPMLIGTALDGVDLMTAPMEEDGLTLTTPDAWAKTLDGLGGAYPHVVVDCPSVLDDPEGLVLREVVDRLVLVVRAGRPRREVEKAVGEHGARVLGVVVNGGVPSVRSAVP